MDPSCFTWHGSLNSLENGSIRSPTFGDQQWALQLKEKAVALEGTDREFIVEIVLPKMEDAPAPKVEAECLLKAFQGNNNYWNNRSPGPAQTFTFSGYWPAQEYTVLTLAASGSKEFRIEAEIKQFKQDETARALVQRQMHILKTCLQGHLKAFDDPTGDVIFIFREGTKIYSSKRFLSARNEHFRTMFSQELGFAESSDPAKTKGESKDKLDEKPGKVTKIAIQDADYRTYRAMLWFLSSGEIKFAFPTMIQRASLHAKSNEDPGVEVENDLQKSSRRATPEAIYILADVYGIDELKQIALETISSCFAPATVLYILFSELAAYKEINDSVQEYILKHWNKIKESPAYHQVPSYLMTADVNQILAWHAVVSMIGTSTLKVSRRVCQHCRM